MDIKYVKVKERCMESGSGNLTEEELLEGSWMRTILHVFPYYELLDEFLGTRPNLVPTLFAEIGVKGIRIRTTGQVCILTDIDRRSTDVNEEGNLLNLYILNQVHNRTWQVCHWRLDQL